MSPTKFQHHHHGCPAHGLGARERMPRGHLPDIIPPPAITLWTGTMATPPLLVVTAKYHYPRPYPGIVSLESQSSRPEGGSPRILPNCQSQPNHDCSSFHRGCSSHLRPLPHGKFSQIEEAIGGTTEYAQDTKSSPACRSPVDFQKTCGRPVDNTRPTPTMTRLGPDASPFHQLRTLLVLR